MTHHEVGCGLTHGNDVRIEWSDLVAFQHEFTNPVRELTEDKLRKLRIKTIHGIAQFENRTRHPGR